MQPEEAFKNIGTLMTAWVAKLPIRDAEHNARIKTQLEKYARIPTWDLSRDQIQERDGLMNSFNTPRTVSHLKRGIPGLDAVLKGSPRMDTGAAIMLLGSYADFSKEEDNATSDELIKLVVLSCPDWDPRAPIQAAKTKRQTKPK